MPSGYNGKLIIICTRCGKERQLYAKEMCQPCYIAEGKEKIICSRCGKERTKYAKGFCASCYRTVQLQENPALREGINKRIVEHAKSIKDKIFARNKRYRDKFPEKELARRHKRMARLKNLPNTLTEEEWQEILKQYHHACAYCGDKKSKLQREHNIPAVRGGGYTKENIVPACATCNYQKGTMTGDEFRLSKSK